MFYKGITTIKGIAVNKINCGSYGVLSLRVKMVK